MRYPTDLSPTLPDWLEGKFEIPLFVNVLDSLSEELRWELGDRVRDQSNRELANQVEGQFYTQLVEGLYGTE